MRMRVSIARSLVARPRLLLMDEPFAALDEFTRHALQEDLLALWRDAGCSVVFVTHSVYEAAFLAPRIVLMSSRPGRIVDVIESPWQPGPSQPGPSQPGLLQTGASEPGPLQPALQPGPVTTASNRRQEPAYAALVAQVSNAMQQARIA